MYSFLTDELVWAAIREREDEVRSIHPHTSGWPKPERSMAPPNPLRHWLTLVLGKPASRTPQYR